MRFLRVAVELVRPVGQADVKSFEAFRQVLARFEQVKYEDFDREIGILGDMGSTSSSATSTKVGSWIMPWSDGR